MFNPLTPTVDFSVAQIARRRDPAALNDFHALKQSRARLYPAGARVFVAYRLAHRPHPYRLGEKPLQRAPVNEVCRYSGPALACDVYDVETDQTEHLTYHMVTAPDGDLYRVLPGDVTCVDLIPSAARVPAVIPPVCRALALVESAGSVVRRLAGHIAVILLASGRSLWTDGGALHLGPRGTHWTLRPTSTGIVITPPLLAGEAGRGLRYPVRASLSALTRLVKRLQARFQAAEESRFWSDLRAALAGLVDPQVGIIPRDRTITISSSGHPRLKIRTTGTGGCVTLHAHVGYWSFYDGQRPAWTNTYQFYPLARVLYDQIAAAL